MFPILGSVALVSLFLAFKYLDKALINRLLGGYFAIMGTLAVARIISLAVGTVAPIGWQRKLDKVSPSSLQRRLYAGN